MSLNAHTQAPDQIETKSGCLSIAMIVMSYLYKCIVYD